MQDLFSHFAPLQDPRTERTRLHKLEDIIFLVIVAVVAGADHWTEIEQFGRERLEWLRRHRPFENGIPSHDTLGSLFSRLDPLVFEGCFAAWAKAVCGTAQGETIAIDGKTARGSAAKGKAAIHLVSAWSSANRLSLGQAKVDGKSNEITAIPALLDALELTGATVTIDAMGCQKAVAGKIKGKGGDYILAVKENHPQLLGQIEFSFRVQQAQTVETWDKDHGRMEHRKCSVIRDLRWVEGLEEWEGLAAIVRIESERLLPDGSATKQARYYISSCEGGAAYHNGAVRGHWGIENGLHWVLDVAFGEDGCQIKDGTAAENFALVRKIALNMLWAEKSCKLGIKAKRKKAGWSTAYLEKVMNI